MQHQFLRTLLSDIAETLILEGLVIYQALDFGSGAVHIRILRKDKTKQKNKRHQSKEMRYAVMHISQNELLNPAALGCNHNPFERHQEVLIVWLGTCTAVA